MTVVFGSPEAAAILAANKEATHERRRRSVGSVRCKCGRAITLWAETEEWYQLPNGKRWYHSSYGIGTGYCEPCEKLYAETLEGHCRVYQKEPTTQ